MHVHVYMSQSNHHQSIAVQRESGKTLVTSTVPHTRLHSLILLSQSMYELAF